MPRCNLLMFLGLLLVGLLGSMDFQVFQLIWKKIRAIMSLHIFWLTPTLVCLKLSHSLLLLLCVFSLVFFLNFLFWVLHYYACKFIDFSSVMSSLLLIPSSMFFHLRYCTFYFIFHLILFYLSYFYYHVQYFLLVFEHMDYSYSSCFNVLVSQFYYLCQSWVLFSVFIFFSLVVFSFFLACLLSFNGMLRHCDLLGLDIL